MLAPWPTNRFVVLVLLACLTDSSALSTATTVLTVYLPFTAVHEPTLTFWLSPAANVPEYEPVSVLTVAPVESAIVTVTPCEPLLVEMLPWFFSCTVNATDWPADGLPGFHDVDPTRSALCTGATTRFVAPVKLLFESFSS